MASLAERNSCISGVLQQGQIAGRSLGWYDFGARMYDASLGRFFSVDPKAIEYYVQSPYVYAANNPIKYIDKNGENPFLFGPKFAVALAKVKIWAEGVVDYASQTTTSNGEYRSMSITEASAKGLATQKILKDGKVLIDPVVNESDVAIGVGDKIKVTKNIEAEGALEFGTDGVTCKASVPFMQAEGNIDFDGNVDGNVTVLGQDVVGKGNDGKISQKFGKLLYIRVSTNPGKIKEAFEKSKEIEIISNSYFFSTTRNEGEDFFY